MTENAESATVDEALLQQFAAAIVDIMLLEKNFKALWSDQISHLLPLDGLNDVEEHVLIEPMSIEPLNTSSSLPIISFQRSWK